MKASKRIIKATAHLAIERTTQGIYDGMCDPIAIELCKLLHEQGIKTQGIARTKFLGEHPHYVVLLSGKQVNFTDSHQLLVDPTILQFKEELADNGIENIPETKIVTTKDGEWVNWYQNLEPIDDKRLNPD